MEAFRLMPHPSLSDGACDCHIHIYSPTQGVAADGSGRVMPKATLDAYRGVQARLGLRRAVIAQPNAYGTDNTTTLSAVAALGTDACGVAIVTPSTPEAELARLHRGGIRGARCHMLGAPLLSWTDVEAVAARVARLGWHVQVQLDGGSLPAHEALLRRLPCPIVIDHLGKFLDPVSPSHATAQVLLRLLETGRHWLKLAAPYEVSRTGGPDYAVKSAPVNGVLVLRKSGEVKFPTLLQIQFLLAWSVGFLGLPGLRLAVSAASAGVGFGRRASGKRSAWCRRR